MCLAPAPALTDETTPLSAPPGPRARCVEAEITDEWKFLPRGDALYLLL